MKRSISVTSINSSDSVIPIEIIEPKPPQLTKKTTRNNGSNYNMQTRSKLAHNNSNNSNTSSNNSLNNNNNHSHQQEQNKGRSLSPFPLIYVDDSEATTFSETTVNGVHNKNDDDTSSFASSDVAFSEKSSINSSDSLRQQQKMIINNEGAINDRNNNNEKCNKTLKLNYKFAAYAKEDHGNEIYSIQIYNVNDYNPSIILFATVGSNRCSIYEYNTQENGIKLIDSFIDADEKEIFFSCCWTTDYETNEPLVIFGGFKGIARTILPLRSKIKSALFGHGSSINDLRIHPKRKSILLSASKDYTIRLWNLKNDLCVCILGGCEGHRDEVLSADFNLDGSIIMSCSIDHSLKMWYLNNQKIRNAILESENIIGGNTKQKNEFITVTHHFPDYTTRDVHTNYIDCVRWFGDLILSKSCENNIVLWKPGLLNEKSSEITRTNKNVSIIYKILFKECDIWFVRFSMDLSQKILALGTQCGKIYVWNLDVDDPNHIKHVLLSHPKSKKPIRSTSMSLFGKYLIAVNDESYIWIWKQES